MNTFSIKDIENLTGIKAHTIRIWEQRYGILQPKRTPTNIRFYDAGDLKLALRIALLNDYGYKISRIHKMNDGDMDSLIQKINDRDFKMHLLVNELLECTFSMEIDHFEQLLDMNIRKHGTEHTVEQLIFHYLEKVGLMWMTNRISPAQEHLVSNVIYRKLAVAIENLPKRERTTMGPSILLFLPEGEIHDLGLIYIYYLLMKYNKDPIYLGPNSPVNEVKYIYEVKKPKYMYVHLTSVANEFDGVKYLNKLSQNFPGSTIYVSGSMLKNKKYVAHDNLRFFHTLQEAKNEMINL
ncbi:MAG: MerR family transcriptional regulator [Taibaiella sp.]|nr:MerR family transcriptional regulator [Taibaiella sp.]